MQDVMQLESVNRGVAEIVEHGSKRHESGIRKRPIDIPVRLTAAGVDGDTIVDLEHHGGADQAVYAYSTDDYDWWREQSGDEFPAGTFGENLTVRGMPSNPNVGDRLLIGTVVLEVTGPRIPCRVFAAHMQDSGFGMVFRRAERPGVYFRVLNGGSVAAGDAVTLADNPSHNVSILDLFHCYYALKHDETELERYLAAPIAERFRLKIENKLANMQRGKTF